jgi:hypothetical protein
MLIAVAKTRRIRADKGTLLGCSSVENLTPSCIVVGGFGWWGSLGVYWRMEGLSVLSVWSSAGQPRTPMARKTFCEKKKRATKAQSRDSLIKKNLFRYPDDIACIEGQIVKRDSLNAVP